MKILGSWLLTCNSNVGVCHPLFLSPRGACEWEDSLPPAGYGLLQPAAVRVGRKLLPQVPVLLSTRPAGPSGGSLLHQAVLQTGQCHATQTEGTGAHWISVCILVQMEQTEFIPYVFQDLFELVYLFNLVIYRPTVMFFLTMNKCRFSVTNWFNDV